MKQIAAIFSIVLMLLLSVGSVWAATEEDQVTVDVNYIIPATVELLEVGTSTPLTGLSIDLIQGGTDQRSEQFDIELVANETGSVSVRCSAYDPAASTEWNDAAAAGGVRMLDISGDGGWVTATITDTAPITATSGSVIRTAASMAAGASTRHTYQVGLDEDVFSNGGSVAPGSYVGGINVLAVFE